MPTRLDLMGGNQSCRVRQPQKLTEEELEDEGSKGFDESEVESTLDSSRSSTMEAGSDGGEGGYEDHVVEKISAPLAFIAFG